jgi:FtsH-binding integral membrane protein
MPQRSSQSNQSLPDDGTTQLLRWGSLIMTAGALAIGLLMTVLGGVGVEGAHSNSGWLALIIGAMCLPFGLMLTVLGAAKWLRRRNLRSGK